MPNFVQYGKVGKPIVYNTLPTASEDLKGVCGQVEDKIYICDGSNWNLFSNTTLKKLLDATHHARYLFSLYVSGLINDLIAYDDTSNVTMAEYMFGQCTGLANMPVLNFRKVQTASYMFYDSNLQEFSLEMANEFSSLRNIDHMFYNCKSLTSVALFDTSNVNSFNYVFAGCPKLTSVPLFNTSNVYNMSYAFAHSPALTSIPLFNTSKTINMEYMFFGCSSLVDIPLLDTSKTTSMYYMFYNCRSLTTIPLLDTSKCINLAGMFYGCERLTTIPALDVSNATSMGTIFTGCTSLKSILMTGTKVSFNISASTKFEESDLVTIINNLATVTTTQTLTMGATNLAKLTDEDKAIATNKGWTLA